MQTFGLNNSAGARAGSGSGARIRHEAENAASYLPPLLAAAEKVAATITQGIHGRRRAGPGDTFWHFRQYQVGDPIQRIDWRQSAKRRHVFIRENEWEIAQSVWIWLDRSASMNFSSDDSLPEKSWRAAVLSIALASLLIRGGERVALLDADQKPQADPSILERMAEFIEQSGENPANLPEITDLPRHSRLILVSDFLSPPGDIEARLRHIADTGVRGHIVQIVDPAEETLPFNGRVRFDGMEGEGSILIGRVEAVRLEYSELMRVHREAIAEIARSLGWSYTAHSTDQTPETALLALYNAVAEQIEGVAHA